jgi:hypothetical protein
VSIAHVIAAYIDAQWKYARKALIGPQAAEELLCGATMHFFEGDQPATVYVDEQCTIPHANPVVADAYGQFPAIFRDPEKRMPGLELRRADGSPILRVEDASDFFGPSKLPTWFL